MSGCPGAGKSTIAHEIGRRLNAIIIDVDILKTAILEADVSFDSAGSMAYDIMWTMARSFLEQGFSVVIDSPCYYQEVLDTGLQLAHETNACYRYIECVVDDLAIISRRLKSRTPLRSQRADLAVPPVDMLESEEALNGEELFREWIRNMKRPSHSYLRVDTLKPLVQCLTEIMAYLEACE